MVRDEMDDRLLPHQIRRPRLTKGREKSSKTSGNRKKALETEGAIFRAVTKTVQNRHVNFGILPLCQNYKSETGCIYGRKCFFRHCEAEEKPSKKGGAKGLVALLMESTQLVCVSQDSYPRKICST